MVQRDLYFFEIVDGPEEKPEAGKAGEQEQEA